MINCLLVAPVQGGECCKRGGSLERKMRRVNTDGA